MTGMQRGHRFSHIVGWTSAAAGNAVHLHVHTQSRRLEKSQGTGIDSQAEIANIAAIHGSMRRFPSYNTTTTNARGISIQLRPVDQRSISWDVLCLASGPGLRLFHLPVYYRLNKMMRLYRLSRSHARRTFRAILSLGLCLKGDARELINDARCQLGHDCTSSDSRFHTVVVFRAGQHLR